MSLAPFSFLNLFSLSSFKGLNWFEGLKRIKIFLQWLWGVPFGLGFLFYLFCDLSDDRRLNDGIIFIGLFAFVLPIIGFELLFRAVVWIVAGFMQAGDSKTEAIKMAEAHQPDQLKKKVINWWDRWIKEFKNIKVHHVLWAIFFPLWFYIWYELVTKTSFCPISHWKDSGFSYPLKGETMGWLESFRLLWYVVVTILRALLALIVLLFVYHLYSSVEQTILMRQKQKSDPRN